MSVSLDGQKGQRAGREDVSLRTHASPPADLLPQLNSNSHILPPGSLVPAEKSSEVTCRSEAEAEYLNVFSRNPEEEDEGSISEWSEEDLSLYFSPSVILQSDNEESESGLEGVDVTIETQVEGEKRPEEVAKQQVLLWGKDKESLIGQVTMKDELSEMGGFTKGHDCQHSFLRQNSMPASLNMHPTPSGKADSYRVYKGQIAGTSKDPTTEGNPRCLKKSNSLDETKTKMASSLIMNILSKKMQVERGGDRCNGVKKNLEMFPVASPSTEQQGAKKVEETGEFKAPLHLLRDGWSFIKLNNSKYSNLKTSSCDAIGQKESISSLSAVEANQPVAMVTAYFNESENRKQDYSGYRLGSGLSQSEPAGVASRCGPEHHSPQCNRPQPAPTQHLQLHPPVGGVGSVSPGPSSVKNQSNSSHVLDGAETKGGFGRTESQAFPWSFQRLLPAQVGSHMVFTAAAGALISFPSLNTTPAAQRKMLVDPETGQLVQVFLPAQPARSTYSTPVLALSYANPAHVWGNNPAVLPLVHFPPLMGVPFLYGTPCLPVTMTTSQTCDDVTPHAPR